MIRRGIRWPRCRLTECRSGYVLDGAELRFAIDPPEDARTGAVQTCFHIPVVRDGQFIDLVRFTREHPKSIGAWGSRACRNATWLGEPEPPGDGRWPEPTHIWRSPLAWLKAGRKGLCYLRQSWPSWRLELLRELPAVMGEDTAHALFLDKTVWPDKQRRPLHWSRIPSRAEMMLAVAAEINGEFRGVAA